MPQNWGQHWPLPDGSEGMDFLELLEAAPDDPHAAATRQREASAQTLGNLTILSSALNTAQSNLPWDQKRKEMAKYSLLPINQMVLDAPVWDEATILARGEELFGRALKV